MDETNPRMRWGRLFKSFIYNLSSLAILGPFTGLVLLPFESFTYIRNCAFWPQKSPFFITFYILQIMQWAMFITAIVIAIQEYGKEDFGTDLFLLSCMAWQIFARVTIIAIRHGSISDK